VARLDAARTRVTSLVDAREIGWRPLFQTLLWPPIEGASVTTTKAVASGKGLAWCNEVVTPFDRAIKGKYPFQKGGHDVALADLADFYKPEGVLWAFYQATLAGDVPRVGDRYEFAPRLSGQGAYSGVLLTFLTKSQEITTILFPPGSKDPLVEFEVRIRPSPGVAQITFDMDGQSVKTQNEPDRWFKLKWPGPKPGTGAVIKVKGAENLSETLRQDGDWGLFRLLEDGRVQASMSSRVFSVTWALTSRRGVEITFDIRPARTESPFFGLSRRGGIQLLQSFRGGAAYPPHSIARGGGCVVRNR
jgi:type VI secretion system protein ImpL